MISRGEKGIYHQGMGCPYAHQSKAPGVFQMATVLLEDSARQDLNGMYTWHNTKWV
jgi:hypothetical protein